MCSGKQMTLLKLLGLTDHDKNLQNHCQTIIITVDGICGSPQLLSLRLDQEQDEADDDFIDRITEIFKSKIKDEMILAQEFRKICQA
jgi:hypothetical protein